MQVTLFQRNTPGCFSLENVTKNLAENLPKEASVKIFTPTVANQGLLNNLIAGFQAMRHQGDVNHITGHVHYLAFFLNPQKTIITMHDCERLMSDDWNGFKKLIYKHLYFKWPAMRCRFVTTISEESKKNLIKYAGVPAKKICVIPNGINAQFRPLELSGLEREELLKNNSRKKTLLHISVLQSNKNIERLLEALKGLDVKLIRVGALRASHVELLKQNRIDYLQCERVSLDQLARIYNAVDCLALPSLVEGFGLPIIEAQACGCPVVTSNISSMPEVAGGGAVLVGPYSIDDIHDGIQKVLNESPFRKDLIRKGFENVRRFNWPDIARLYNKLYREIISDEAKVL